MDNNSSVHIRTSQQVVVKPYKVGINCQTLLFQKLCITLHAIKQFRATQQTAHFQTLLGLMWMDVLNARMVVTQNSEVS